MLAQESCDIYMIFKSFFAKPSTHTIHPIYFQKCTSLFPEESVEFCHKDREEIGGATAGIIQLAIVISQDHPMTPDGL